MDNKGLIPIATNISSYGTNDRREVIFSCPVCDTSFKYYHRKEKFCHNCGQKINWDDVEYDTIVDPVLIKACMNNLKKVNETLHKINVLNHGKSDD